MGIEKLPGEYCTEMTEPGGWPEIDESLLRARASEILKLRNAVHAVLDTWQSGRQGIANGTIWSGAAATSASSSLTREEHSMAALDAHLSKSYAFLNLLADTVEATKQTVNQNLSQAYQFIAAIQSAPEMDAAEKDSAIRAFVSGQHAVNAADVLSGAASTPPFSGFAPAWVTGAA